MAWLGVEAGARRRLIRTFVQKTTRRRSAILGKKFGELLFSQTTFGRAFSYSVIELVEFFDVRRGQAHILVSGKNDRDVFLYPVDGNRLALHVSQYCGELSYQVIYIHVLQLPAR